jgi:hypothetical protein
MITYLESQIKALQKGLGGLLAAKSALAGMGDLAIPGGSKPTTTGGTPVVIPPGAFTGRSIVEAAAMWLGMVGQPARSTEAIVDALKKGGLQRVTPASTATLLIRDHNNNGPIVRVQKGLWGLEAWYPKRPPRLTGR